ncbi:hypothetical protein L227DRAFT_566541 [Lentinus tigrinus ALCF2SS1-6]|uniref:Uncharacterized protein n=2 Tax=Lentinus tigrinus TaxID=5365 RepID=A0A5C2RW97_9APHY|nr:hypothetical protein L227DRAFT_566541 [Lentinus tigrinus ALCF2SS1-6]
MLSSLGFDNKGASRNNHSGSRLLPNVPRGFSVHVFKNPTVTLPAHSNALAPPMPPVVIPSKYDTRPSNGGGGQWTRQQSYHASHTTTDSSERKQLQAAPAPPSQDHRLVHVPAATQALAWPVETKHSHSHSHSRSHSHTHSHSHSRSSKSAKSYGIYPSLVGDVYVYERSISSVSFDDLERDELASSPSSESSSSSSSSGDSDLYGDLELSNNSSNNNTATITYPRLGGRGPGNFNVEISSTRASSSTETLESTLAVAAPRAGTRPNVASSLPPPPPPPALAPLPAPVLAAPPRPASTRPQPHPERDSSTVAIARSAVPLTRAETQSQSQSRVQRSISISAHATVPPIQLASAPLDDPSDDSSDSETVISATHANDMVVDMLGAPQWAGPTGYGTYPGPMRSSTPFRRSSDPTTYRRDAPPPPPPPQPTSAPIPVPRDPRDVRPGVYREDSGEPAHPRAPPGLSGTVATPPDANSSGRPRSPPRTRDTLASSSSSSPSSSSPTHSSPASRSPRQSPGGSNPGAPIRNGTAEMGSSSTYPPPPPPAHALQQAQPPLPSSSSSPPRREVRAPSPQHNTPPPSASQTPSPHGSPTAPNPNPNGLVVAATVAKRSVRWTENLVCPSPVPPESRRKGWFNRRGDQLWTNDGQYKMPEPGTEYPPDLAHYPEPNAGWMNEEGVRIDMQHRLIPKQPLRSALKRAKPLSA